MPRIEIEPEKGPILLIDTSYYIFYRYFATYNWYRRQSSTPDEIDASNIMNDPVFMDTYKKMFEKTLMNIVKVNKIKHMANIIFVKDCSRDNIWRHQHFEGYKAGREDKTRTFNRDIFGYTYKTLILQLQEKIGFQTMNHNCLEADDVAAIVTKTILDNYNGAHIIIITNDNDYIQLLNHEAIVNREITNSKLRICNLQDKNICERVGCTPLEYISVKKIMGDKSDNIPSIIKKCGDKTALKLATNKHLLAELLAKDPTARSNYERNELLIDFCMIPGVYCDEVRENILIVKST